MSFLVFTNLVYLEVLLFVGYGVFLACMKTQLRQEIGWTPFLVFGIISAACFLAPALWLLHVLFVLVIPIFARSRAQVGQMLLVGLFATPTLILDLHFGQVPIFGLSAQGSLAIGAAITMFLRKGRSIKMPSYVDLPAILVLILLVVIGARDTSITHWLRQAAYIALCWGLPYYVVTRTLTTPEMVHRACIWFAAACSMLAVVVLFELFSSWPLYSGLNAKFDLVRGPLELVVKIRGGLMRAEGPMEEATAMGFVLVLGLGAAFVARPAFRSRASHIFIITLIALSLVTPQSRGGWLGAAIIIISIVLYRSRAGKGSALIAPFLVACALTYAALTYNSEEGPVDGSASYRALLWQRGIEEIAERPLLGASYNEVVHQMTDLIQGEGIVDFVNSFLYFGLVSGLVGLLAFTAFLGLPISKLWRMRRELLMESVPSEVAAFCFGSLLAATVMFSLTSFNPRVGLPCMIVAGFIGTLVKHRRRGFATEDQRSERNA